MLWRYEPGETPEFQSTRPRGARRTRARIEAFQAEGFNPRAHAGRDPDTVHGSTRAMCGFNPRAHAGRDHRSPDHLRPCRPGFNPRAHAGRDNRQGFTVLECVEFQSTRPRGARLALAVRERLDKAFQSTRPRGARPTKCSLRIDVGGFNPRAHAGRDVLLQAATRSPTSFNPRAHAGRDPAGCACPCAWAPFQSTRPRGARLDQRAALARHADVSIHAPTRGATFVPAEPEQCCCEFQSTRPRGARHADVVVVALPRLVSIHAPTRGATLARAPAHGRDARFNPRAHAGRDPWSNLPTSATLSFNPRAHAGRDELPLAYMLAEGVVSIHAPTRGATPAKERLLQRFTVSIHAPTRGATAGRLDHARRRGGFNPRAHAGRDGGGLTETPFSQSFQSTRPRGARRDLVVGTPTAGGFQSTRPRGARRMGCGV